MAKDIQFDVGKLLLSELRELGFVLAGGRALVELKLTNRPTRDLDLFTGLIETVSFDQAIERAVTVLAANEYTATLELSSDTFARLRVANRDDTVMVELGYDYREYAPVELAIGSVLDARDAILNKISALYARSLPRDFIDVHSIRLLNIMSDTELLVLSRERDEGFVMEYFVDALRRIKTLSYEEFSEYGVSRQQFNEIKQSTLEWADDITRQEASIRSRNS